MDCACPRGLRREDDRVAVEIALRRGRRADADGDIGVPDMRCFAIGLCVGGDRAQP
jgi:hypothetical protein